MLTYVTGMVNEELPSGGRMNILTIRVNLPNRLSQLTLVLFTVAAQPYYYYIRAIVP